MPPKKRNTEQAQEAEAAPPPAATAARVTRASTKRAAEGFESRPVAELPAKKKIKKAKGKTKKEKEIDGVAAKTTKGEGDDTGNVVDASKKTIVIEHCKQCNSFKTRANLVKESLEKKVSGLTVILNPEKPRRGCFEIREEGGKTFISLLDMKRPFKPMKDLDMDKVISDIFEEISVTS